MKNCVLAVSVVIGAAASLPAQAQPRLLEASRVCDRCLTVVPEATLGATDGPGALGGQPTINVGDDGRFYVLDPQAAPGQILVSSSQGVFQSSFGRSGRGAGEYSRPLHMIANRNRLDVVDVVQLRVTRLDPARPLS